jgi:hypothetical protein
VTKYEQHEHDLYIRDAYMTWYAVRYLREFYIAAYSSVGILPGYELDGRGSIRGREGNFSLRHSDQMDYPMGIGDSFTWDKVTRR